MLLLCLGDSITDCGRIFDLPPLGNGYVRQLANRLNNEEKKLAGHKQRDRWSHFVQAFTESHRKHTFYAAGYPYDSHWH